jgi:flagellar basal body-associated protein FliL
LKELENGKKKLLVTGIILIIIAVCAAGIFAYGSHKNNQKAAAKVQEESVQRVS